MVRPPFGKLASVVVLMVFGVVALSATDADGKPKARPKPSASASASSSSATKPPAGDLSGPRATCTATRDCHASTGEECVGQKCICDVAKGNARCNAKDDFCTWLKVNANHCGSCGHNCGARGTCDDGKCSQCKAGETVCPGDASEKVDGWDRSCHDLQTEDENCGKCGRACPSSFYCKNGHCVL